jgi:murein DD-endopeptidase MepM/ murein hydrolase activator NlpD
MTGRLTELPCAASGGMLEHPRIYTEFEPLRLLRIGLLKSVCKLLLSVTLTASAALPAAADAAPAPQSRPVLQHLEARPTEGTASRTEPAKIAGRLRLLGKVLASAGVDLNLLVADASTGGRRFSDGQGGPLVPAVGRNAGRAAERYAAAELDRLRRMQNVLLAVPLASPMAEYEVNSGFGYRRDPIRRRGALHTGMDLGGTRNAPVLATAPGVVTEAGRAGAYGIMVVIDHGLGIETRYAHLSRALVAVGDKVAVGRTVGLMGRSGRATGPHLHYEIRFDGRPLNPRPFLEAGGQVRLVGN